METGKQFKTTNQPTRYHTAYPGPVYQSSWRQKTLEIGIQVFNFKEQNCQSARISMSMYVVTEHTKGGQDGCTPEYLATNGWQHEKSSHPITKLPLKWVNQGCILSYPHFLRVKRRP